jgi:WNK lysine deficient protein kinase
MGDREVAVTEPDGADRLNGNRDREKDKDRGKDRDKEKEGMDTTGVSTIVGSSGKDSGFGSGGNPLAVVADMSPNKRYIRWSEVVSQSESNERVSYKAFDTKNGMEVVWHTINLNAMEDAEQARVVQCLNMVKNIQHKYVLEYQASWFFEKNRSLNIITTHLEPLVEFIEKVMTLKWRIIKKWTKQILQGLEHLHSKNIVHRNLTCAHIYINGGTGHTNIGDLWMAAILEEDQAPIGLSDAMMNAFTAPDSAVSSSVDIYSLGMCVLQMIFKEEPYQECGGSYARIRNKVLVGQLPDALHCVNHAGAFAFISECLKPASERPSATELLAHTFLQPGSDDDDVVVVTAPRPKIKSGIDSDHDESSSDNAAGSEAGSSDSPVDPADASTGVRRTFSNESSSKASLTILLSQTQIIESTTDISAHVPTDESMVLLDTTRRTLDVITGSDISVDSQLRQSTSRGDLSTADGRRLDTVNPAGSPTMEKRWSRSRSNSIDLRTENSCEASVTNDSLDAGEDIINQLGKELANFAQGENIEIVSTWNDSVVFEKRSNEILI